jgi:hypothetical protein
VAFWCFLKIAINFRISLDISQKELGLCFIAKLLFVFYKKDYLKRQREAEKKKFFFITGEKNRLGFTLITILELRNFG